MPIITDDEDAPLQPMYQFSRAIYRDVAGLIETGDGHDRAAHEKVLKACEQTVERLAFDRHSFANPVRTLFRDIRVFFPVTAQRRVLQVVRRYLAGADDFLRHQPVSLPCRATTRRGTPCRRPPLPHSGYCPSHQHLCETEEVEVTALAA